MLPEIAQTPSPTPVIRVQSPSNTPERLFLVPIQTYYAFPIEHRRGARVVE